MAKKSTGPKKSKKERAKAPLTDDLRLAPEQRLVPSFDSSSTKTYPVAAPGEMGMRVLDNCAEDNIQ